MGLLSKALTVSTGGASKLVAAGIHAGVAHQAAKATEGEEGDEPTVSRWTKLNDRHNAAVEHKADAKAAAKDVRVWTFTSRPGNVAKELQKEIVKQARDGFTLTSQNVSAGHSKMRTLQVITAIFTRTV